MQKELSLSLFDAKELEKITDYLQKDSNVLFAVLFGSVALAIGNKSSAIKARDIDIGIFFRNPPCGLELLKYIDTPSELVRVDIELVVLNSASPFLRHQIMKKRVVIVIKDLIAYTRFKEKTISDYQEYRYISGMSRYA